jgi:hypothetical protein
MASSSTEQTKRERQKQRRDAKVAEQQRQLARARRNRVIALGALAVVALAAIGLVVQDRLAARRQQQAVLVAAQEQQAALGCTDVTQMENLGGGHLQEAAEIAGADPATIYPDRPASSGLHLPAVAATGVYDEQIDERLLLHNLEHGYVHVYYDSDADPEQVEAARTFVQGQIDGDRPEMIMAPYGDQLQGDANFAFVSWGWRQMCGQYSDDLLDAFLQQHYNTDDAPEVYAGPHRADQGGVLDPNAEEGPLLFPPLAGAETPEGEATEQPAGSSEIPSAPMSEG